MICLNSSSNCCLCVWVGFLTSSNLKVFSNFSRNKSFVCASDTKIAECNDDDKTINEAKIMSTFFKILFSPVFIL